MMYEYVVLACVTQSIAIECVKDLVVSILMAQVRIFALEISAPDVCVCCSAL